MDMTGLPQDLPVSTPCPSCGETTLTAGQRMRVRPPGTYSLAGAFPKAAATLEWALTCINESCNFTGAGQLKG